MELRRATVGDAAALAEQMKVVVDEGGWLATESDRSTADLEVMFSTGLEDKHNIVFCLEDGDRVVGSIGVYPSGADGVLSLGMSILAEYRGLGWGRKMVDAALIAARNDGARKIELEVFPDNGRAVALYAGSGFEVEGLKRDHYPRQNGSVRSALLMARLLSE